MDNLNHQRTIDANAVFAQRFLNSRSLYLYRFNHLPSVHFIGNIEGEEAYKAFKATFAGLIVSEYQYRWFKKENKKYQFDETVFVLSNNCVVEMKGYCEILHDGKQDAFIQHCTALMGRFKERKKRMPLEINLIVKGSYGLELKAMEIKRTKLDLDLFYDDDFKEVDAIIQKRLNQKKDKGIILLHGLPGTGKTTYLRYLVGKVKKRVLFLSPNVAANLMDPDFIDLLIDNPNTVVIIEDAENIIMDRRAAGTSSVSNLLNISDGLLADFLNVQLICTFNSPLTMVDDALMRKGRLIAKYAFKKLGVEKAQRLSDHFGFDRIITEPMTVAEISSQNEKAFETKQVEIIGFRRSVLQN
ncbi:AAA family ATPase [Flavisolibacter nicotianae]|uniref:AAA family ATPase n=1 Tax=Flavisolibacter nicotianae TaxID=2364882 RepID=UPI000EB42A54|nr:AAA family ATPase [Flavisolibacter nicotianae]